MQKNDKKSVNSTNKRKIFRSSADIVYLVIISALAIALVCSLVTLKKKNQSIMTVKSLISQNENLLKNAESKIRQYETQIAEKDKTNSDTLAALEEARNQKSMLEKEIEKLKKQIENLSAAKAEAATVQPAVIQEPPVPGDRVCYLTFDDGPSDNTLKILDILNRYGIKATFFVINSNNISYIKNIFDAGHTVGLHTNSHKYSEIYSSPGAYFSDLNVISGIVERITGVKSSVIRFPGGSSNMVSKQYCPGIMTQLVRLVSEHGFNYYDWNVSSGDAVSNTPSYTSIRNNVLSGAKDKNSACVLMHDSSVKTTTVQALPEIIEGLTKMGYRFEAIKPDTYGYHHRNLNN